jgi:transposase
MLKTLKKVHTHPPHIYLITFFLFLLFNALTYFFEIFFAGIDGGRIFLCEKRTLLAGNGGGPLFFMTFRPKKRKKGQKKIITFFTFLRLFPSSMCASKRKRAKMEVRLSVADVARLEAPTSYRLTKMQILIIQQMWEKQKAAGQENVEAIMRKAKCSRNSVYLWRERGTTECSVSEGRPRSTRTPAAMKALEETVAEHKRKPMTHGALGRLLAKKGVKMAHSTLHAAKKELGIRGTLGARKPERAFWQVNRKKRLAAANERKKWSARFTRGIIWFDESEALRKSARVFQIPREADGTRERPIVPAADPKEEKVRFLVAFGNGHKLFHALPLRRAVKRDAQGRAKYPRGARRRKAKAEGVNAKLNAPNKGETWTATKLI